MTDREFAIQVRRLLISIATLICRKYGNDTILVILKGIKE